MNPPLLPFLKPSLLAACGLLLLTACTLGGNRSRSADGFLTSQTMTAGTTVLSAVMPTGKASFSKDRSAGGAALKVAGVTSARGLGVSAPSTLTYDLGAQCRTFTARVGVDDESGASGSATFKVLVDNRPVFDSGPLKAGAARAVNVNVEGGETLNLVVEGGSGPEHHADWADAKLDGCVVYKAPIEVMPYGSGPITISGNYRSDDPDVPAIKISTTQPVVIQNCVLAGRGHLISTRMQGSFTTQANVTVQNCRGYGLNPDVRMREPGRFLHLQGPANVTVQNNFMKQTGGIYVQGGQDNPLAHLQIVRNRALNIDGRRSDGEGGWLTPGPSDMQEKFFRAQFVQLNDVRAVPDAEIAWNRVENEPGYSRVEDNISIYVSSGTPGHPIRIQHNLIRGAYAYPPDLEGYSGGGIITDGCVSRYVDIGNNTVLETSNHGIAIANGENVAIHDNLVLGTGLLAGGKHAGGADNGIYVRWARNCSQMGVNLGNNSVTRNTVGFGQPTASDPDQRHDLYVASNGQGKPLAQQSGNTLVAPTNERITRSQPDIIERAVTDWEGQLGSNNVVVGAQ
ncbi:glycosyl hydrolase [Deinococcus sp. KSM4-11]|uniref:NPCBM/NEW2 domain-containing protein n=1 Tax=Deinococcus sp. KSM4-11 TaxID=2568654 RepID=UPI0010A48CDC|nr:NPCBM/NEW2 domain-containing protein [Deinococcus sp. KSM4-11]THF86491.1 glycosyl hydrolase [Deinococcus sp. KSM4-11]